jgi:ankyrin repeat protein
MSKHIISQDIFTDEFSLQCKKGNIVKIKVMIKNNNDLNVHIDDDEPLCNACENGHLDIVKLLLTTYDPNSFDLRLAFTFACEMGQLKIIKYFHNNNISVDAGLNNYENGTSPFMAACGNGKIKTMKFLLKHYDININSTNELALKLACIHNQIGAVKFLLNHKNNNININIDDDCIFRMVCKSGHVHLLTYLLNIKNNNININSRNDQAFRMSCSSGKLDIVKLLLNIVNNNININSMNNFAFHEACKNGHVNVSTFLLQIPCNKINIHNEDTIRQICIKRSLNIAKFFCSIDDRYYAVTQIFNKSNRNCELLIDFGINYA